MLGKVGRFVFFLLLLTGTLLGNVLGQFFTQGTINPVGIIAALIGFGFAAFIHFYSLKKLSVRWMGIILLALTIPLPLAGLISYLLSLFQVNITIMMFAGIYLLGLFVVLTLLSFSPAKKVLFQDVPEYDERQLSHFAWAGAWSFLFLIFLIIGALIQPWVELNEQGLWIGVLLAGLLFWLATIAVLGTRK